MNSSDSDKKCCDPRTISITTAVVVACLIFVGLVWKMRQYTTPAALGAQRATERDNARKELQAAEADALKTAGYVDPVKKLVRLPIEDAKAMTVKAWQNPAAARADLLARVEKANVQPPKPPEKPSPLE
jgi:hypothetical protein